MKGKQAKPKINTLRLWRVDVPRQVFMAVMGDRIRDLSPINIGTFRVHAETMLEAFNKVWDIVGNCGVPVSSMEIKVGEYPSEIECYVD